MTRMNRFDARRFRPWRPAWWQLALLAALAIAVVLAVAIVATRLVLILAPVVLVAVIAQRFLARRAARRSDVHPGAGLQVIDAEYEIVSVQPAADRLARDDGGAGGKRDE